MASTPVVNSFPRIRPMVAFSNGPWDFPVTTWTELTDYVRSEGAMKITRGRSNEFSQFNAGKITGLALDNRKRYFDNSFLTAPVPFRGNAIPTKQLQMLVEYPWLPGLLPSDESRNTGWTTAAGASLSFVTGDSPPGILNTRALGVSFVGVASIQQTGPRVNVVPGQPFCWSAKVKKSSFASTSSNQTITVQFFQAGGVASAITPSASATVLVPVTTWGDRNWSSVHVQTTVPADAATAVLVLISQSSDVSDIVHWDGLVADHATYVSTSIIYTYVDDWKLTYKMRDALCTVEASDAFASFSVKDIVGVGYETAVTALPSLRHYWTLGERADWTAGYTTELAPGTATLAQRGFVGWGVPGPLLADLGTGVGLTDDQTMQIGGWFDAGSNLSPAPLTSWYLGFWVQMASATDRIFNFGPIGDPASVGHGSSGNTDNINLYCDNTEPSPPSPANKLSFSAIYYTGATSANLVTANFAPPALPVDPRVPTYTTPGSFYDGAWHFVVIQKHSDDRTFEFWVDGVQVTPYAQVGTLSGKNVVSGGVISPSRNLDCLVGGSNNVPGFTGQLAHLMVGDTLLSGAQIANLYDLGQAAWFGQTPQSRLSAVLDVVLFPSSMRVLDVGNSTFDAETQSLATTNALQYMQYAQDSENGWFFMDKSGNARLISRQNMLKPPYNAPSWVLGDLWPQNPSAELPLIDAERDNSNTLIYTEAEGSRHDGPTLYAVADNATISIQGKRSISKTNLLNAYDAEVYNILNYLISQYKTPHERVIKVKVKPEGSDALWQFVLNVEIGQVVQINLRPPPAGTSTFTFKGRVQQIDHTIAKRTWETELALASADVGTYLVLDDPVLGKMDTVNMLAY